MGLDLVEMVMEIEDEFGIRIPDADCQSIRTVGQLCDYVNAQRTRMQQAACPTSHAFYRVRRCLLEAAGISKRDVHPRRLTAEVIPAARRRRVWQRMHSDGLRPPALRLPRPLFMAWLGLCVVALLFSVGLLCSIPDASAPLLITSLWAIGPGLAWIVLRPAAVEVPAECATVGRLAMCVAPPIVHSSDDRAAVEATICRIVSETLAVPIERVVPEARLVEDLGAG